MKIRNELKTTPLRLMYMALFSCLMVACSNDDIDNNYSRHNLSMVMSSSSDALVLNEATPDETALTMNWTPATDHGADFVLTYCLQVDLEGSKEAVVSENLTGDHLLRGYTNKELNDILIDKFKQLTSTTGNVKFTITASYTGPYTILSDVATKTVKVKTYGAKQFLADKLYMSGTAVGNEDVVLEEKTAKSGIYVYTGPLTVGKINFPALYDDEDNAFAPSEDTDITSNSMPFVVVERSAAKSWNVNAADTYRVTLNLKTQTLVIIPTSDIVEIDKLYLAGTAVEGSDVEVTRTVENENLYAFKGDLKAGTLYIPILFNGAKTLSIVPNSTSHDIDNGVAVSFAQVNTASIGTNYWTIPADGTYRIVVDTDAKTVAIYYGDRDLTYKIVGPWNGEAAGLGKNYTGPIVNLWMYGGFNGRAVDAGSQFENKYMLVPSLANPHVFIYQSPEGETIPRKTVNDEFDATKSVTGSVRFCVHNGSNNVYAFGSTANASRTGRFCGYTPTTLNVPESSKEGQSDNRYAYFLIPEGANTVIVDTDNLTVTFKAK